MKTPALTPESAASSRRDFLRRLSLGVGVGLVGLPSLANAFVATPEAEYGLASLAALQSGRKLGVALVGLGGYSSGQLAPALQQTKLCHLAGIVTGTPDKATKWKQQYNIPDKNIYTYENFDSIKDNPDIDIVYVVLPNALHAEYVERAARAGKHVICEKPMATSVEDCRRMIDACKKAGKKLSIGYRLHFDPYNLAAMRIGQNQQYGPVKKLIAENGFTMGNNRPWRIQKKLSGGGPLMDMGIYCVQGVIYTKGQVPVSVTAKYPPKQRPQQFNEVEEAINWQFQFADGSVADCRTSYVENVGRLRMEAANGWLELQPAYAYNGLHSETSKGPLPNMPSRDISQQALQMDDFADCVLNNKPTRVPGEMGLRDVQLLKAIYQAADSGQKVSTKDVVAVLDKVGAK
ncbi:Gfo/Idh/MocA family oxidoreductase [Hymenobacter sp. GOD-10R]|uniref:Gfo/Idh/MocA family protein n=1 Tax=Hymenobacter sp. GOD-10R TaxID=3093922 RepID=UPI002D764F88|nr:Gfo/Idh/MocA family oxidoreductase [Hymenobacter sp. GOD-10R]WRQ30045.1 Gfo/Idh/MocA family oxidoreductase [Hymenobacter sp. GOD-10R]